MSFGQKPIGKAIWGTTTYRVLLETPSKTFSEEMSGVLTLFERRWVTQKAEFDSRKELIEVLRGMWENSLRQGIIQDARFARWLEEYLNELGIKVDYDEVLSVVKGETVSKDKGGLTHEELVQVLGEEKVLEEEELEDLTEAIPGIISSAVQIGFNREIQISESGELTNTLIEKYKPTPVINTETELTFVDVTGTERKIVQPEEITAKSGLGGMYLTPSFVNSFGSTIEKMEWEILIPNQFSIDTVDVEGGLTKIGETLTEEGLVSKWSAHDLKPGHRVSVSFKLLPRIVRTIIIQSKTEARIIRTFEPLVRKGKQFIANTEITNSGQAMIMSIVILDQIPRSLNLVSSSPEIHPPLAYSTTTEDTVELNWTFHEVPSGSKIEIDYIFEERPYILRDIYVVQTPEKVPYLEIVKIEKKLENFEGSGVIIGARALREIGSTIVIEGKVEKNVTVVIIDNSEGDISVEEEKGKLGFKWVIRGLQKDKEEMALLRLIAEEEIESVPLTITINGQEPINRHVGNVTRKDETLVLPRPYYKEVDALT